MNLHIGEFLSAEGREAGVAERRAKGIVGYVLDQGMNAYTDSGRNLLQDPKVIELYLGTLARVD